MISIIGPTASGKTRLAAHLAKELSSEVVSADSRQVYVGMDLGTGKDLSDYQIGNTHIPYHLIDIVPAGSKYNLYEYQRDCHKALAELSDRGIQTPILCGGTGLYVESIIGGYQLSGVPENPELRAKLQGHSLEELQQILASYCAPQEPRATDTAQRTIRAIEIAEAQRQGLMGEGAKRESNPAPKTSTIICLDLDREERRARISRRLRQRLDEGMTTEVERLLASGIAAEDLIYYGLEYKWVTLFVIGEIDYKTMAEQLEIAIHQFAKRQMTWFRGMERRGYKLHYVSALAPTERQIEEILNIHQHNN